MLEMQIPNSHRRPTLTADEEKTLFAEYLLNKDIKLRNKIVEHNLGLVFEIARTDFRGAAELANEGVFGLITAVERFDPSKGTKFSTYARFWIRHHMFDFAYRNQKMVRCAISMKNKKLFYNLSKVSEELKSEGLEATSAQIAKRLLVTEADVVMMQQHLAAEKSMDDTPALQSKETRLGDMIASDGLTPEEAFTEADDAFRWADAINSFKTTLRPSWLTVFNGCLLEDRYLADVARELNISRERVRQIREQLMIKFRRHMANLGMAECDESR